MKKRILSMLLALTMLVGMIPATTLTANALMYTSVDTWDELIEELSTGDAGYIMLEDDITAEILIDDWFGDEQYDYFRYEVEADYKNALYPYVAEPYCTVTGNKTLDLNGYSIKIKLWEPDIDFVRAWETTMFYIPEDAALTVNDSGQDGSIEYTGCFAGEVGDLGEWFGNYSGYLHTDVFQTSGKLIVNGGKIEAGNTRKEWLNAAYKDLYYKEGDVPIHGWLNTANGEWFDSKYARQMVWGTAVNVESGGTLVVNGGTLIGRGQGEFVTYDPDDDYWGSNDRFSWRDSVIEYATNSAVIVNGGSVKALGGANVFKGNGDLTVRAGYFQTDKHDYVRCLDAQAPPHFNVLLDTCETVISGSYGDMGIPDSAWNDEAARMQILVDNAIYNGNAAGKVDLDETGGQTSGESLKVTIVPWLSDNKLPVTLNGGPYSNYPVSDGQVIDWNVKSDNLVATVDYEPYFDDTTGLKDAAPVYTWHLWGNYGTNGEVSKDIVTTTGRLDISAAWEEAAGTGNFHQMKVSCVVSEAPTNCAVRMETKTNEFRLDPTKTPLDESSMPGGKMEVDISYPGFSGSNTDIVVTVKPSAEDLADAAYGSSTVRYEFMYRDGEVDLEDEPFAWYNNTYNFSDTDWGHVKFDVTMIVHGADGIGRRFTKSAWALKLPDITVSGATLNSDKTAYVGNPGSPVTLKAPIDVTNAQVAADKIVASDIAGLYRITYDNSGKPVMSLVTAGSYTQYQVTGNGTYCYAAYDRDGNLVYSKPVKVEFNAEAYGISITKSNDYIFTVYNNGSVVMPLTITATYGSSVEEGNIRWAIQSYPQGMSTSDFTYVNANGKSAISFQKLFKDVKTIVPGNYMVMAYVVKDGQYLTASNTVIVEVGRIADFVDITDEAGNVISGKTMEGPYVGNTMKLNCVPGNGASAPSVYTVAWTVESLVGTNVATIDANGVLTINKPGQIKVTATATVGVGQTALANNTQTVIINIPITEVEVTLGTPTIGGDPDAIASVPADAPYELVYNPEYSWISGVHPDTDKFAANLIPELRVGIAPKDGYVFPARQTDLAEDGDETWFTYADEVVVKVNGTAYNFRDFEKTYTYGYTEYGKDYDGTFYEDQEIRFYWTWDRLRSASDTYLDYVNLSVDAPAVGSVKDTSAFNLACSNNAYANNSSYIGSVYKVSGDNLNDNDTSNDNAVSMATGETYAKGEMYRVTIMVNLGGPYTSPAQYFEEQVTAMVNNEKCIIEPITGSTLEGQYMAKVSYYFMPTAPIETIENLYIDDLEAPVGYRKPATADDITEFYSNFAIDDEVYVTRLTWFYDVNNNGVIDTGEDSADSFNADGSFIAGLRYSVYIELEARDRDDDGKGDYVKFADNAKIYLSSQSNAQMTGNQNGAVYKFPAATVPAKAVTTDPGEISIELEEGYDFATKPVKTVNVTSVGTTEITSIIVEADDSTLLLVAPNGMSFEVAPQADLAKGTYRTSVVIKDDGGNVLTTVPVTINVTATMGVSGTITSFGSTTDVITVELWKDGATSATYSTTTKGNSAGYSIPNVAPGTYTMKVNKYGHTSYTAIITVGDTDLVHNVTLKLYQFGQTVQIRLIEPWGLKANARVHDGILDNIDYSTLYSYGVYFIRASELDRNGVTAETITIADIIEDSDATHMAKGNGVTIETVDGQDRLTAIYDKGLYTYEFSDSVYVLFYVKPTEGGEPVYAAIRERNLSQLVRQRKDQTSSFSAEERAVYLYMEKLEDDILSYRSDFVNPGVSPEQSAPTLAENPLSGSIASSSKYSFGHKVQVRLIEPWGIRLKARVYTSGMTSSQSIDYSKLQDYGVIVLMDNTTSFDNAEELLSRNDAYVFSASNGDVELEGNMIAANFTKDIYTYLLNSDLHVMFYVKDDDGYHFGQIKVRNLYELMLERKEDTTGSYTEKEKIVYQDMVDLYTAITAYRASLDE